MKNLKGLETDNLERGRGFHKEHVRKAVLELREAIETHKFCCVVKDKDISANYILDEIEEIFGKFD